MEEALTRAKKLAGGAGGLADALGNITPQAVSQWTKVPANRVLEVERITGVSRHDLRPDIYGPKSTDSEAPALKAPLIRRPASSATAAIADAAALRRRDALTGELRSAFETSGFNLLSPAVLQPADLFLDRSGEDIRRRLYVFTDPGGDELCLRPDLTIPTCHHYLETTGGQGTARYCYAGPVYRYQAENSQKPNELMQTGAELLGQTDIEAADAEIMALCVKAVEAAGLSNFTIEMGDLSLFEALVNALDIPAGWRSRLKRHFWRPDYFQDMLEEMSGAQRATPLAVSRVARLAAIGKLDEQQARALVEETLELANISVVGGRSIAEIAERYYEQAVSAAADPLSRETAALINHFLALNVAPQDAAKTIAELAKEAGITLAVQIEALNRRFDLLQAAGVDLSKARFATSFGRKLEYYTGFVFELQVASLGESSVIAGGGRYDGLLQSLGAPGRVPAVGCAVTVERLVQALGGRP